MQRLGFSRFFIGLGAFYAAMATAMLAARAHALTAILDLKALDWVETAAEMQLIHGIAIVCLGFWMSNMATLQVKQIQTKQIDPPDREDPMPLFRGARIVGQLLCLGVALFSGALYGRAFFDVTWITRLAPFGGAALILGWLGLCLSAIFFMGQGRRGDA